MFGFLFNYPFALICGLALGLALNGNGWRRLMLVVLFSGLLGIVPALLDVLPAAFIRVPPEIWKAMAEGVAICAALGSTGGLLGSALRAVRRRRANGS